MKKIFANIIFIVLAIVALTFIITDNEESYERKEGHSTVVEEEYPTSKDIVNELISQTISDDVVWIEKSETSKYKTYWLFKEDYDFNVVPKSGCFCKRADLRILEKESPNVITKVFGVESLYEVIKDQQERIRIEQEKKIMQSLKGEGSSVR